MELQLGALGVLVGAVGAEVHQVAHLVVGLIFADGQLKVALGDGAVVGRRRGSDLRRGLGYLWFGFCGGVVGD